MFGSLLPISECLVFSRSLVGELFVRFVSACRFRAVCLVRAIAVILEGRAAMIVQKKFFSTINEFTKSLISGIPLNFNLEDTDFHLSLKQ